MNTLKCSDTLWMPFVIAASLISSLALPELHAADGQAVVRGLTGQAVLAVGDAAAEPLPVGATVSAGTVIKSGARSAVDLFLGENVGTVRLAQNTSLRLDKLTVTETNSSRVTEVQLTLNWGTILGTGNRAGYSTTYQVKVSTGVGAIGSGLYRLDSRGYLVLLEGSSIFAHVPSGGEPKAHELKAPPPVYFSPVEGIRRAPRALVKEVENQWRAKLHTVLKLPVAAAPMSSPRKNDASPPPARR